MASRNLTPADRFWSKVKKTDSCWLWTASVNHWGYGKFSLPKRNWMLAHRAAWLFTHGVLPDEQLVLHRCDNPPCVNPDHLFLGTHADNVADKMKKGRYGHRRVPLAGELNGSAKLTEQHIRVIRASMLTQQALADLFNVKQSTISSIQLGKTWKHL